MRGSILPSRLEVWAAHRGVRGREARLLGPLAERVCCHPPNFSTRRARRDGGRRGWRGEGKGRREGGRGASGSRSAARMRPAAGAAPRPARPDVPLLPPARGRVSHGPAPPGGRAPARPPRLRAHGAGGSAELRGSRGDPGASLDRRGSGSWAPSTSRPPAVRAVSRAPAEAAGNPGLVLRGGGAAEAGSPGKPSLRGASGHCGVEQVLLPEGLDRRRSS